MSITQTALTIDGVVYDLLKLNKDHPVWTCLTEQEKKLAQQKRINKLRVEYSKRKLDDICSICHRSYKRSMSSIAEGKRRIAYKHRCPACLHNMQYYLFVGGALRHTQSLKQEYEDALFLYFNIFLTILREWKRKPRLKMQS